MSEEGRQISSRQMRSQSAPFLVPLLVAFIVGLALSLSSRAPPRTCGQDNPFRGLDELVAVGAIVLLIIILGVGGLIVSAAARSSVGRSMMAVAAGLLLAVVVNALLPRPAETGCVPDTRSEPATVRLIISSPFQLDHDAPGVCFNVRDPDPDYVPSVHSDAIDEYDVMVHFISEDSAEQPYVDIFSMAGDLPMIYSGPADWITSESVRFTRLAGDEPGSPTLSGTVSWRCLGGPDGP